MSLSHSQSNQLPQQLSHYVATLCLCNLSLSVLCVGSWYLGPSGLVPMHIQHSINLWTSLKIYNLVASARLINNWLHCICSISIVYPLSHCTTSPFWVWLSKSMWFYQYPNSLSRISDFWVSVSLPSFYPSLETLATMVSYWTWKLSIIIGSI